MVLKVTQAGRPIGETPWFLLENAYFYTDSYTDLPMLEAVKFPVVVSPDRRLERLARKRQWPIENWQTRVATTRVLGEPSIIGATRC